MDDIRWLKPRLLESQIPEVVADRWPGSALAQSVFTPTSEAGLRTGSARRSGPAGIRAFRSADPLGLGRRAGFPVTIPVALAVLAGARLLPGSRPARSQGIHVLGTVLATSGFGMLILPPALGPGAGWSPWALGSLAGGAAVLGCSAAKAAPGRAVDRPRLRGRGRRRDVSGRGGPGC